MTVGCADHAGKNRHADEHGARAAGMFSLTQHKNEVTVLWPYLCRQCRGWFLTKNPKRGVLAITVEDPYVEIHV